MKEKQTHQKESEQLDFLNGTTKKIANKKEEELGEKSSLKPSEERPEIFKKENNFSNIKFD